MSVVEPERVVGKEAGAKKERETEGGREGGHSLQESLIEPDIEHVTLLLHLAQLLYRDVICGGIHVHRCLAHATGDSASGRLKPPINQRRNGRCADLYGVVSVGMRLHMSTEIHVFIYEHAT